jgi:hypothetical protein
MSSKKRTSRRDFTKIAFGTDRGMPGRGRRPGGHID